MADPECFCWGEGAKGRDAASALKKFGGGGGGAFDLFFLKNKFLDDINLHYIKG